jgi:hypothetical protein
LRDGYGRGVLIVTPPLGTHVYNRVPFAASLYRYQSRGARGLLGGR